MHWFLIGAAGLHLVFMVAELFPWGLPKLLVLLLSKNLPEGESFKSDQQKLEKLVATIVHNAGIYNGIVAGGLLWASFGGDSAKDVARVMLLGAAVAGIFGTATLKSWVPAVQAAVGLVGLILVW